MDSARQGPEIVFDPLPGESLSRLVSENVISANIARTGVSDWHPVGFFLKSPRGEWLGGLTGYIWGGWLHVNFLWVSEALRGQPHGTRLMDAAEAMARERGAVGARRKPSRRRRPDFTKSGVIRYLVVSITTRRGTPSCFYRNGWVEYRIRASFRTPVLRRKAGQSGIGFTR
jgi:GNAT superfamily N-acetyltransferase